MSHFTQYPGETVDMECTRSIKKVTVSHKFKIMGYSLDKDIGKGKFLKSTIFCVGGYDWSIRIYPNGTTSAEDDDVSMFLFFESEAECVKAQVCFAIIDQNGSALPFSKTTEIRKFKSNGDNWGYSSFAKRAELEPYIRDDCLIIKSTVTIFKVCQVESSEPIIIPPGNIIEQISHLLETGNGADITFQVNGTIFNAHRCILAARSPVFLAQFFGPLKEKPNAMIKIEEMEAPVFKSLLHFIYYDSIPEFEEAKDSKEEQDAELHVQHLLAAADKYGLERLKIICQKMLYDTIDISNAVSLLSLAERHSCIDLKKGCLKYLVSADKVGEVIEAEEFQQLVKNDPLILKELLEK
jgi:speckle-type POZ protein